MRVEGRVQGVGFRWWTRAVALELGVRGWVRNTADGAVEVHAAGPRGALAELKKRLGHGPASARVDSVRVDQESEALPPSGFEIRLS